MSPSVEQCVSPSVEQCVSPSVEQCVSPCVKQCVSPSVEQCVCVPQCGAVCVPLCGAVCVPQCGAVCVSLYSGAGCVIHWTRQIKEVLNAQEALEQADTAGPLEEIEFWTVRCEDLSGLTTQLDQQSVDRVSKILERAKSSYLTQFKKLTKQMHVCVLCVY